MSEDEPSLWDFQDKLDQDNDRWLINIIRLVKAQTGNDPYAPRGLSSDKAQQQADIAFYNAAKRYAEHFLSHPDDPGIQESTNVLRQLTQVDPKDNIVQVQPTEEMFKGNSKFTWERLAGKSDWNSVVRHLLATSTSLMPKPPKR